MEIYLARTQGFCAGVACAIDVVDKALEKYGTPLYVFHEIVHNTAVINGFRRKGVCFVDDLNKIPDSARVIFSAHGVPPSTVEKADQKNLKIIDATCPLVKKVHTQAVKFSEQNIATILIGHKKHQEMIGTAGYVKPGLLHIIEKEEDIDKISLDPQRSIGYLTQTTLSMRETSKLVRKLKERFPNIMTSRKGDICYATQNRQEAVLELSKFCEIIIICGSPNSSNSNRLKETAQSQGVFSCILDRASELDDRLLKDKKRVGISSGASVPRFIVKELIALLRKNFSVDKIHVFENTEKNTVFPLPPI